MKKIKLVSLTLVATALLVGCGNNKGTIETHDTKKIESSSTTETSIKESSSKDSQTTEAPLESTNETTDKENMEIPVISEKTSMVTPEIETVISQEVSDQGKREQLAQDRFWEAVSWGWTDEEAARYGSGASVEEVIASRRQNEESERFEQEANDFEQEFYLKHGRLPSSGEIQAKIAADNGWMDKSWEEMESEYLN